MMATLYKGTSAQEFFDLSQGMNSQVSGYNSNSMVRMALADNSNSIAGIEAQLSQPLEDLDSYLNEIDEKYQFDSGREPLQYPLAMLFELPLSSDYYEIWIAYKLMNTILFSPALELETMDYPDIQKIFSRLIYMLAEDYSIGDIVYEHMATQENWRRFRSPEDNTREMQTHKIHTLPAWIPIMKKTISPPINFGGQPVGGPWKICWPTAICLFTEPSTA
jgi:hypothetical protein